MNQMMDRIERASLIVAAVIGRWSRFAKSGFKKLPKEYAETQARLLLIG